MNTGPTPAVRKLQDWDTRASVRVKPRRFLLADDAEETVFFSRELVPVALHTLIRQFGPAVARELQVQHVARSRRHFPFMRRLRAMQRGLPRAEDAGRDTPRGRLGDLDLEHPGPDPGRRGCGGGRPRGHRAHHAEDKGRHCAYFSPLFGYL
jgi:hypothetical protein